jgi:glycosyltransferase involved in cell wall biosynthesis
VRKLCFIVNVDWFFHSHRRPLEWKLSSTFNTSVIAGESGIKTDYIINTFEVNSRVPTIRGVTQFYKEVKKLDRKTILVIVSPVMIILSHFLLRIRKQIFYNFSGLGFLRSKSSITRNLIMYLIKLYPVSGNRVFVVQNTDDYKYLNQVFKSKKNLHVEIIEGSGYEAVEETLPKRNFDEVILGYVGRIRKDKGILDLTRAVSQLENEGYNINLKIWGNLDDSSRHGFSEYELEELNNTSQYFQGFSTDKPEIFGSFNWFCLPSNGEGLSKAAIEASSFGLPLLLSNVQGNRDMIKGNGYLFEYGDIENLKKVLIEICDLSEGEVQNMSERSKSMFEAKWTLESIYNRWKQLLIKYDTFSTQRT